MKVLLKAFPVVHFTVHCRKHDCLVEIRPKVAKDRSDTFVFGGQLSAIKCEVGGSAQHSNCVDSWEMAVSSSGSVTING